MSVLIYKVASTIFTLSILGRILFLLGRFIKKQRSRYVNRNVRKRESSPQFILLKKLKAKKEFEEMMTRDKAHRKVVEELHYDYKGFVNLSRLESDRKKLFEDKWMNWRFSKNSHELQSCPGDYQAQCIKMFGEMSFVRKSIIVSDPNFWTEAKEDFWRKICHPAIKKTDVREKTMFDTRQRIIAEDEFNRESS